MRCIHLHFVFDMICLRFMRFYAFVVPASRPAGRPAGRRTGRRASRPAGQRMSRWAGQLAGRGTGRRAGRPACQPSGGRFVVVAVVVVAAVLRIVVVVVRPAGRTPFFFWSAILCVWFGMVVSPNWGRPMWYRMFVWRNVKRIFGATSACLFFLVRVFFTHYFLYTISCTACNVRHVLV